MLKSKARRRRIELAYKKRKAKAKLHSRKTRRKKIWVPARKR
jgi:hypothetical protein